MTTVPRVSENPVVQQHYATQLGLTAALANAFDGLGPDYRRALAALTREFQAAAISLSADYYTELRETAQVPGTYRPPVIDPWSDGQLSAYLDAATKGLLDEVEQEQALSTSQRLTLDSGHDEIFAAMDADPKRPRWARVARPDACSFCLMLAARGAVYRSKDSAGFQPHTMFEGRGGDCRCGVEVSFTSYEPAAHVRAAQSLYSEATADLPRGADRANAFRRALYAERKTSR